MKHQALPFFMLLTFTSLLGIAQVSSDTTNATDPQINNSANGRSETREIYKRKGNFFFYWGYNRSAYTNSDIHFWGDGYDFTITAVRAKDEPTTTFKTYGHL